VVLDISYDNDLTRQIKEIKETLHRLPNKGIGYGILKYLTAKEHKKEVQFKLNPQFSFNYLGQFDADVEQMSSFEISNMPTGNSISMKEKRPFDFDISGMIVKNRLNVSISFNKKQYKKETVENLVNHYKSTLSQVIDFSSNQQETETTPSDFTYKGLSIDQLDQLFGN
jgi:non-ribosomal peptide synthase protein (TIGR01720 family)